MFKALSPGAIGVRAGTLEEAIAAARTGGFGGVEFNPREMTDRVERDGADAVKALFSEAGLKPAGWGLPVEWRGSEENWRRDLAALPRLAQAAGAIGGWRTFTWIPSASDERALDENRRFHIERFAPVAQILADHGCSFGMEFLGPKTLREGKKFDFIYTLPDMLALGAQIGPNVGVLLDCWHWYTSGGTVEDLLALRPEQVVYVHVNDAPPGIPLDEQRDNVRALPGETGVIDIAAFLKALRTIGYDGPVTPEPFKKELADLPSNEARLQTVGAAMDAIFAKGGLG